MTIEILILTIISMIPTITSLVGIIAAVCKFGKATKNVVDEIHSTKEYEDLRAEMKLVYKKNAELQEQLNAILKAYNELLVSELEVVKSEIKQNTKAVRALTAKTL